MPVAANLDQLLDKAYENVSLADLLTARVSALAGVADANAELLQQAFRISTVGDLGRNQFFRAAQASSLLADSAAR